MAEELQLEPQALNAIREAVRVELAETGHRRMDGVTRESVTEAVARYSHRVEGQVEMLAAQHQAEMKAMASGIEGASEGAQADAFMGPAQTPRRGPGGGRRSGGGGVGTAAVDHPPFADRRRCAQRNGRPDCGGAAAPRPDRGTDVGRRTHRERGPVPGAAPGGCGRGNALAFRWTEGGRAAVPGRSFE